MRDLVIPIVLGAAITFVWMAVWALALRALGVPVFVRTPEERNARKQRILQMGKLQYVLIYGVLGRGVGIGIGVTTALMMSRGRYDWGYGATMFGALSLTYGLTNGISSWNQLFHVETPFPPHNPASK